jgi:hypothetical protein
MHHYFRTAADVPNSAGKVARGLDVRSLNGFALAPPSRHESGRLYEWETCPGSVELAEIPRWLLERACGTQARNAAIPNKAWRDLVRSGVMEGARNDTIARLAGLLLRRYVDPLVALELISTWNLQRCEPPLEIEEVRKIVDSIARRELRRRGWR